MGGMAAQIPIKNEPAANEAALEKVRQDKLREVSDGCDGTWVAHPGLVFVAREVLDPAMPGPNQVGRELGGAAGWKRELVALPTLAITAPRRPGRRGAAGGAGELPDRHDQ